MLTSQLVYSLLYCLTKSETTTEINMAKVNEKLQHGLEELCFKSKTS
jgi:hypothetical protein